MKKNNKKSQAHVEIILATVLFISFVIFILIFINSSLKTTKSIPTSNIETTIINKLSEEIGKLSIVTEEGKSYSISDNIISTYGNKLKVIPEQQPNRFTVYFADFLTINQNNPNNCQEGQEQGFSFGTYIEEEIISERNIVNLKTRYADYSELKQSLGIDNFAFEFRDSENKLISDYSVEGNIPANIDIISKDFPVRVINNEAEISQLTLNIKIWR